MSLNAIKYVSFKKNITKYHRTAAGRQGRIETKIVRTGNRKNILKKIKEICF